MLTQRFSSLTICGVEDIDGVAVCLDLDPNGDSDVANATVGFGALLHRPTQPVLAQNGLIIDFQMALLQILLADG